MALRPRPGKQSAKKEWYIRTRPMPAYDIISCSTCGKENMPPNEQCVHCGATLPWEEEQEKYNSGLVSVLGYTRPGGVPGQYLLWFIDETVVKPVNKRVGGVITFCQGRPWHKHLIVEKLPLTGNEDKGMNNPFNFDVENRRRVIYAVSHFIPGYLLRAAFGMVEVAGIQEYWYKATSKGLIGGLEEKSIYVAPLVLVDLDNVEGSLARMAPVTVQKVRPLVGLIEKYRASYSLPIFYNLEYLYNFYGRRGDPDYYNPFHEEQRAHYDRTYEVFHLTEKTIHFVDTRINRTFEISNKKAALVVYMHESFKGKEVYVVREKGSSISRTVTGYQNGDQTQYAAVFDDEYIPWLEGTTRPLSSLQIEVYTWIYDKQGDRKYAYTRYLEPGKVTTVDLTHLKYRE